MSSIEASSSDLAGCHDDPLPNKFSIRDYVFTSRKKDIWINWPFPQQLLQVCLDNGIRDVLPPFEPSSSVRDCGVKQEARFEQLPEFFGKRQILESVDADGDAQLVVSCDQSQRDPMASKVCPVCKSFSATSNTTLNAHIDGCLSPVQPNVAADVTECSKVRPKPRKKRLMVDIYTTARHCTLEELDKRNGTNWATNLALVAPSISDTVNRGDVGDIYVDSNGMKLLILSKFNDSHPFITRRLKLKTGGNEFKASKTSCLVAKKKSFTPKCSRFMEDNQKKKKLSVNMGFRGEIEDARKGNNIAEAHQGKEEYLSHMLSAQEQIKSSERTNLGHWVCSKRSDLLRRLDGKDISKRSEKMVGTTRKLLVHLNQPGSSNCPKERTTGSPNFSRSSVAMASSPRTKRVNILSNTKKERDIAKMSSCQPPNLNSKSLSGDSLVDGHMANISSHIQGSHPSLKVRKNLISKKSILSRRTSVSLEASDGVDDGELVTPKKFQKKRRSVLGCSKWPEGDKYSYVNGGCHGSSEDFGLISFKANEMNKGYRSKLSENQEKERWDTVISTETVAQVTDNYLDQNHEEREGAIQIDSPSKRSTHNQEMQDCGNAISNDIIGHNNQLEGEDEPMAEEVRYDEDPLTDTGAVQEPHPCFTNREETWFDCDQTNTSETSFGVISNQDHKMVADMESSDSPASTYPQTDTGAVQEPSCSCSQSLHRESQLPNSASKKKMASDLYIKTSTLSAYPPCQSMESPTESVVTMASPKSSENLSNSRASAMTQATPYPILRLMGKDLVVHKEDAMQLPEILPCDTVSFGLPNGSRFSHNSYYHYPIQSPLSGQIPSQPHQRSDKISQRNIDSPYRARELIVIDDADSCNLVAETTRSVTSLFSCFPPPDHYTRREGSVMFPPPSSLYFSSTQK